MAALKEIGYDAVGLGQTDVRSSGPRFFEEAAKVGLTVVNARHGAAKPSMPYVIKSVGGVRLGVVSFGAVIPEDNTNAYELRKSLYTAYRTARQKSDILIVLDQANQITPAWLDRNGSRLGVPDVVIAGTQKNGLPEPEIVGKTRFLPTSQETREIGVLDIDVLPGDVSRYAFRRVQNLWDTRLNKGDATEDLKTKALVDAFLRPGHDAIPVRPPQSRVTSGGAGAAGKPYYAPSLCKTCHVREYEDWARSKHAAAVHTLVKDNKMQSDCLQCHSEQFRRTNAVTIPSDNVGGVECATCHIDALPHGLERKGVEAKTRVSALICLDCHTREHSPGYDEQAYFPKVAHLEASRQAKPPAAAPK